MADRPDNEAVATPTVAAYLRGWTDRERASATPEPVFSLPMRFALLLGFAVLLLLKLPNAVLHGRFMGEEGPIFFAYAWHHGSWDALWRVFGGYLNLAANAFTLLSARLVQSGWLTLEQAPRVTMAAAFVFQLLPAALLLFWRPHWIRTPLALVASLLVLALPPAVEEVWLNVLHVQFYLTLCAALLLTLDPPRGFWRWAVSALVLVLGPLCGPGAMVLGPLFLARAVMERSPARMVQTALLGFSGLLQLLVFFQPSPMRGQMKSVDEIASMVFVRLGIHPFAGSNLSNEVGRDLALVYAEHGAQWWLFVAASLAFCLWLGWVAWRARHSARGWLLAGGLALAVISFGGGMLDVPPPVWFVPFCSQRYDYVPLVLLGLALVDYVAGHVAAGRRWHFAYGAIPFLVGALYFNMTLIMFREGPVWQDEVAQWRRDHNYALHTWPSQWTMDLSDTTRPCPPVTLENATERDPSYCETNWLGRLLREAKG